MGGKDVRTVTQLRDIAKNASKKIAKREHVEVGKIINVKEKEDIRMAEVKIAVAEIRCLHAAEDGKNSFKVVSIDYSSPDGHILSELNSACLDSPKLSKGTKMIIDYFRRKGVEVFVEYMVDEENHDIVLYYISIKW